MSSKDNFGWKLGINMQKNLEIKSWKLYWDYTERNTEKPEKGLNGNISPKMTKKL